MKTIFTLFASLILSVAVFATDAKPKSMLSVSSSDMGDIRVVLNGRRFEPNDNSLVIRELESGFHQVKVYRQKNGGLFTIFGKKYELVYNTSLMIKPRTQVSITIDRFGRSAINENNIQGYPGRGRDGDNRGRGKDWNDDQSYDFNRDGKMGDYDNNYGYVKGMDDRDFNQVLQSINTEWLESNKLKSATQIVKTNSLSAAQVKQMMMLFNFESNKLEVAKQAYANTVDKKNYFIVNDAFSFNSSKDELARYIRR